MKKLKFLKTFKAHKMCSMDVNAKFGPVAGS